MSETKRLVNSNEAGKVNPSDGTTSVDYGHPPVSPVDLPTSPWLPGQREQVEARKQSAPWQSWINSAKLCFGNAYLSIPNVFSKTGWLGGIVLFSIIGALNIYTMII